MKLLVGLGNPGKKYKQNRHNIGFMAVEEIARVHGDASWRSRFRGEVAEVRIGTFKSLLLKPATYMNLSGEAVQEAVKFYKIDPQDVIVLHDEIDLAPGKIKVKSGGGNAGHNGLKSISAHIGNEYYRVRLGVGRPARRGDVANFVLKDFAKADQDWLDALISGIARHVPLLVGGEKDRFMSLIGQDMKPLVQLNDDKAAGSDSAGNKKSAEAQASGKDGRREANQSGDKGEGAKAGPLKAALEKWLSKKDDKGEG